MLRYTVSDISLPRYTTKNFSCWLKRNEVRLHRFETAVCLTWCNYRLESTFKKQTNTKSTTVEKKLYR